MKFDEKETRPASAGGVGFEGKEAVLEGGGEAEGGAAASRAPSAREGRGGRRPTRGPAEGRARLRRIWPAEKIFGGNAIKCRRPGTYLVEEKNDAKEGKP